MLHSTLVVETGLYNIKSKRALSKQKGSIKQTKNNPFHAPSGNEPLGYDPFKVTSPTRDLTMSLLSLAFQFAKHHEYGYIALIAPNPKTGDKHKIADAINAPNTTIRA